MQLVDNMILQILNVIFMLLIGFYLMQNLQWFNYSFARLITKHTKPLWNIVYFIVPLCLFFVFHEYCYIVLIIYIIMLVAWYIRLDKKLVWTGRVKRFFIAYFIFLILNFLLSIYIHTPAYVYLLALFFAFIVSYVAEFIIIKQFAKVATHKLESMPNLKIIAITASYGKTSIKNYLSTLLSKKYRVYSTPRSVNTLNGIIRDINEGLEYDCEIYIAEAGARQRGDIAAIAKFLNPHYAIIGEIGEAHLQYFKSLENIIATKNELVESTQLKEVFIFKDNELPPTSAKITRFPNDVKDIKCTLESSAFSLRLNGEFFDFETKILGEFNISNLSVAIMLAHKLGIRADDIQKIVAKLDYVPHRLEKLEVNGKTILDDSFNGNLNGMRESIRLSSLHKGGKKIIVTPGLVETSSENNATLARLIDSVFDVAIITGELNSEILVSNIHKAQKIVLKDKEGLHNVLASFSTRGDLVLFANDAPNYV